MALTLYYHPLASYCHKVLLALYENNTEFKTQIIDLSDPVSRADLFAAWPIGKIPVLRDDQRGCTIPETSIIIEYLDRHYPGPAPLIPPNPELNLQTRLWDRFFDLYVSTPIQNIGWSERARSDIEIFRLVDTEGLTPLLMVLNAGDPPRTPGAEGGGELSS